MCNLRSGNLSFPHAPLASQQSYHDVPRENPVKHWHDRVSSLRLQGLGEAASKLSFGMLSSGAIRQWLGVDHDTKPRGTEWTEEPRFEADAERDEVGRGGIGRGEHWQSQNSGIVTVTRPRQTGTQMSLGCCLDTSSYHSLLLDLLKLVFHDQNMCLGCWQAKYESNWSLRCTWWRAD